MQSVTPLETIRIASQGNLVTIPGFDSNETFTVRLRRPNLFSFLKSGKIPNPLLETANGLFLGKGKGNNLSPKDMSDVYDLMSVFCNECMVEPTYKELTDAGVELTHEQMQAVMVYATGGVKPLKSFRGKPGNSTSVESVDEVSVPTEPVA